MRNYENWPNIPYKSGDVSAARFLKYVSAFFNIIHERVNPLSANP